MRQRHRAGEKVFVDYSGKKLHLVDAQTGELRPVDLFVGVLGASGLIYAEASADQSLPSWVDCHLHMLEYFGGAPEVFVPDQLKSAVAAPCRYEPEVNRTYAALARHYGAVVIPARARKPKDKAKAEAAVLMAQRWILAVLRDQPFFTLAEINAAIRKQLDRINHRPMKPVGKSRFELFAALDRPALKPLPAERFEMAQWKLCRVSLDYHVEVERNYYSVPCVLLHQPLEARFTASVVELYYRGRRVASHPRLPGPGQYSTCSEHMPRAHREHAEWSPSRLIAWAEKTGPTTARLVAEILDRRRHPEQGYRACLGLMRLGRQHGQERLEAACARAARFSAYSYRTVKNILTAGLDRLPLEDLDSPTPQLPLHENIRGATYYAFEEEFRC